MLHIGPQQNPLHGGVASPVSHASHHVWQGGTAAAARRYCTMTAPCVPPRGEEAAAVGGAASNRGADAAAWGGTTAQLPTRGEAAGLVLIPRLHSMPSVAACKEESYRRLCGGQLPGDDVPDSMWAGRFKPREGLFKRAGCARPASSTAAAVAVLHESSCQAGCSCCCIT